MQSRKTSDALAAPAVVDQPQASRPATLVDQVRVAIEAASLPPAPSEDPKIEKERPSFVSSIKQCLDWTKKLGKGIIGEKVVLGVIQQILPLATAWVGASAVPVAMDLQKGAATPSSLLGIMGQIAGLGALQVLVSARTLYNSQVANNKSFRLINHELMQAGTSLSMALLERQDVQNRIVKTRENIYSMRQGLMALFDTSTSFVGLSIAASSLAFVPSATPLAGALLLLGVLRVVHSQRYGREKSIAEDVVAEPRRKAWYQSFPLRDHEGLENVKHLSIANQLSDDVTRGFTEIDETSLFIETRQARRSIVGDLGVVFAGVTATAYGLFSYANGIVALDQAIFLGAAVGVFASKVEEFSRHFGSWVSSKQFIGEANALISASIRSALREKELDPSQVNRWQLAPSIKIENASLSLGGSQGKAARIILRGLNLDIEPGEFVGIVGASGAGKTTLLKLLLGTYECDEGGKIEIGGKAVSDLPLAELRANTGYLPQMYWNFMGITVGENIRRGNPIWDPDANIEHATNNSGLTAIMRDNGFNLDTYNGTEFGNGNGRKFSGGEHKGIAVARALARQAKLLILDEPLTGLDPDRAEELMTHLRELNGVTRLLVSHDMRLVRQCKRILVVSRADGDEGPGVVEAFGPHEEIIRTSPTYRRFCESQAK